MHRADYLIAQQCLGHALDLGCCAGRRSLVMGMLGHSVLGIDENSERLALARERARACCLESCRFHSATDGWPNGHVLDTIVVSGISDRLERLLWECMDKALAPQGQVILGIPDSTHLAGGLNLDVAALKVLDKTLAGKFPIVETVQDNFTRWRISVFRSSDTRQSEEPKLQMRDVDLSSLPMVSVVMTTYNRGEKIRAAIDSVLKQTYPKIEIIVVNDGSRDNTRDVLEDYGSRIIAIHKSQNEGIAAATNTGLAAASGTFVQRFDDDDLMLPRKVECQVARFQANRRLGLVYTAAFVQVSLPDEKTFGRMGRFIPLSEYALAPSIEMLNSATLVRKECMDEVGFFDTELSGMAECDRFMRIMANHPYEFMPVPGVIYAKHGGNHTIKKKEQIRESAKRIHENVTDQMRIDDIFKDIAQIENEDERRKLYSLAFLRRGMYASARGCHESACKDFERALASAPENVTAKKRLREAQEALAKQGQDSQTA